MDVVDPVYVREEMVGVEILSRPRAASRVLQNGTLNRILEIARRLRERLATKQSDSSSSQ